MSQEKITSLVEVLRQNANDESAWKELLSAEWGEQFADDVFTQAASLCCDASGKIGQKVLAYYDEWIGNNEQALCTFLKNVLETSPKQDWAFRRLIQEYSSSENWQEVYAAYDRQIASSSPKESAAYLKEVADIASNVASDQAQSIKYFQELSSRFPSDENYLSKLEKLLKRSEDWSALIDVWQKSIPSLSNEKAYALHKRIARTWIDQERNYEGAIDSASALASTAEHREEGLSILQEVVRSDQANSNVKKQALREIQSSLNTQPERLLSALEDLVENVDNEIATVLRREIAILQEGNDNRDGAFASYKKVFLARPQDKMLRAKLRMLAEQTNAYEDYVSVILEAANQTEEPELQVALELEAARICEHNLEQLGRAVDLYETAYQRDHVSGTLKLRIARYLNDILLDANKPEKRLEVLGELVEMEEDESTVLSLLGERAILARQVENFDLAIAIWQTRLERRQDDRTALDGLVEAAELSGQWDILSGALIARAKNAASSAQKISDLARAAELIEENQEDKSEATALWEELHDLDQANPYAFRRLTALLAQEEKWEQLTDFATSQLDLTIADVRQVSLSLAEYLAKEEAWDQSLVLYQKLLAVDPEDEHARSSLLEYFAVGTPRSFEATRLLLRTYAAGGQWQKYVTTVHATIESTPQEKREAILSECAGISEEQLGDKALALETWIQLFNVAPTNVNARQAIVRLCDSSSLEKTIEAIAQWDSNAPEQEFRKALLCGQLSWNCDNTEGAYTWYKRAIAEVPTSSEAVTGLTRAAFACEQFEDFFQVTNDLWNQAESRHRLEENLLAGTKRATNVAPIALALAQAFQRWEEPVVPAAVAGAVLDSLPETPETQELQNATATLAVYVCTQVPEDTIQLRRFARFHSFVEDKKFVSEALVRLSELDPKQVEQAAVATQVAVDAQLYPQAQSAFRQVAAASHQIRTWKLVEHDAFFARIESLVAWMEENATAYEQLKVIGQSWDLPFAPEKLVPFSLAAVHKAFERGEVQDTIVPLLIKISQHAEDETAQEANAFLHRVYREQKRVPELLAIRRQALDEATSEGKRQSVRIELADLMREMNRGVSAVTLLQTNLEEKPGDRVSIASLEATLRDQGDLRQLYAMYTDQGRGVQETDPELSASLWFKAGQVSEEQGLPERALECYRTSSQLKRNTETTQVVARIYMQLGRPKNAVAWYQELVPQLEDEEKLSVVADLAEALFEAGLENLAINTLQEHLASPTASQLEQLLSYQKRAGHWEDAIGTIQKLQGICSSDRATYLAEQAVTIATKQLDGNLKLVAPCLEAIEDTLTSHTQRVRFARSLNHAGRWEKAASILENTLAEFGRRRNADRASAHGELAETYVGLDRIEDAVTEMEQAHDIDKTNGAYAERVAELYLAMDDLDRAEKSYRSLLVTAKQQDADPSLSVSALFFRMADIAEKRGDEQKMNDQRESAIAAIRKKPHEALAAVPFFMNQHAYEKAANVCEDATANAQSDVAGELWTKAGEIRERYLEDKRDAARCYEQAVHCMPMHPRYHERLRRIVTEINAPEKYEAVIQTLAKRLRRAGDSVLIAKFWYEVGGLWEFVGNDYDRALSFYDRAAQGWQSPQIWFAMARASGELGDEAKQTRCLEAVTADFVESSRYTEEGVELLYQTAELMVAKLSDPSAWVESEQQRLACAQALETLQTAMGVIPNPERAMATLKTLTSAIPHNSLLWGYYDGISRTAGSEALLSFLRHRCEMGVASETDIFETVDLLEKQEAHQEAETLLRKLMSSADEENSIKGLIQTKLVETLLGQNRFDEASEIIVELFDAGRNVDDLAEKVIAEGHVGATQIALLERMNERQPQNRMTWAPLLSAYIQSDRLVEAQELVERTLPTTSNTSDRVELRMQLARVYSGQGDHDEASVMLKECLLDNPSNNEVGALLERSLRELDAGSDLLDMFELRFDDAWENDSESLEAITLSYGAELTRQEQSSAEIYKKALERIPQSAPVLGELIEQLTDATPSERLQWGLQMLENEDVASVPSRCFELVEIAEENGDTASHARALTIAAERCPENGEIMERSEEFFRAQMQWEPLMDVLLQKGKQFQNADAIFEAATIANEQQGNRDKHNELLIQALEIRVWFDAVAALAESYSSSGMHNEAIEHIGRFSPQIEDGDERAQCQLMIADSWKQSGDLVKCLDATRDAYESSAQIAETRYEQAMEDVLAWARQSEESAVERKVTIELSTLWNKTNRSAKALSVIEEWTERTPDDVEVLKQLLSLADASELWTTYFSTTDKLVRCTEGDVRIAFAKQAFEQKENDAGGMQVTATLEFVTEQEPDNREIRGILRELYRETENFTKLAALLEQDAAEASTDEEKYAAFMEASKMYVAMSDSENAMRSAEQAFQMQKENDDAVIEFSDMLMEAEQAPRAMEVLEEAIGRHKRRSPVLGQLQQRMSRACAVAGDAEGQLKWLKKAFEVDRKSGEIAAELAHVATESGDLDLALKPLRAITLMEDPSPITRVMALLWEAKIEHARGNSSKAEMWAKKALREDPEYQDAVDFLAELQA